MLTMNENKIQKVVICNQVEHRHSTVIVIVVCLNESRSKNLTANNFSKNSGFVHQNVFDTYLQFDYLF